MPTSPMFHFRLKPGLLDMLRTAAQEIGIERQEYVSVSELVREGIEMVLRRHARMKARNAK